MKENKGTLCKSIASKFRETMDKINSTTAKDSEGLVRTSEAIERFLQLHLNVLDPLRRILAELFVKTDRGWILH